MNCARVAPTFIIFSAIVFLMESVAPATGQPYEPAITEHSQPNFRKPHLPPGPRVRTIIPNQVVIKVAEQYLRSSGHIEGRNKALTDVGEALRKQFKAEFVFTSPNRRLILMRLPPGLSHTSVRDTLLNDARITYVTPDYELTLHTHTLPPPTTDWLWTNHFPTTEFGPPYTSYSYLWGLEKIGMKDAWGLIDYASPGVIVVILDRAIDYGHPDLVGNNSGGISYCNSAPTGIEMEHGTGVAGILAARGDNNGTFSSDNTRFFVGVSKRANFKGVRISCPYPSIGSAILGIDYALQQNARVINMSWGLYGWDLTDPLVSELKQAIIDGMNSTLFVASAGNELRNIVACQQPTIFPQMFHLDNLIVVAATNPSDTLWVEQQPIGDPCLPDNRADNPNRPMGVPLVRGSNFGATVIDIGAPGEFIFSVLPRLQFDSKELFWGYVSFTDGTSNAAPLVTGCAALLQTRRLALTSSTFAPQEMKTILMNTGDSLPATEAGKVASGKRLNCYRALQQVQQPDVTPPGSPNNLRIQ